MMNFNVFCALYLSLVFVLIMLFVFKEPLIKLEAKIKNRKASARSIGVKNATIQYLIKENTKLKAELAEQEAAISQYRKQADIHVGIINHLVDKLPKK